MTDRLSAQGQRLLLRYRRLLARWRTELVHVSLAEIAEELKCTPRYARTLLGEMQLNGWLSWSARAGRGAGGVLLCRVDAIALQALLDGNYSTQMENTRLALPPASKAYPVNAENSDGESYTVQFHRTLMKITPSLYTGWPERHLIQMVHIGLMRYVPGNINAVPGLAHTADVSADGLTWTFYLRRGLYWHNGEQLSPEQLLPVLQQHAGGSGLPHVSSLSLSGYILTMKLTIPDVLLPHRLAHSAHGLPHPEEGAVGLGPFRVMEHSESSLLLQRSPFWYGESPHTRQVRFVTVPQSKPEWSLIKLGRTRIKASPEPTRILSGEGGFTFLTFNTARAAITRVQQNVIRRIIQGVVKGVGAKATAITHLPEWLCVEDTDVEPAELPSQLNIVYCLMPETTALVESLKKSLRWRGCQLNVTTRAASHWLLEGEDWSSFDLCIGFQPIGAQQAGLMEEHSRNCGMFSAFWGNSWDERGKKLLAKAVGGSQAQYSRWVMRLFRWLLNEGYVTPVYVQRWDLQIPLQMRDVETCELGWPDFSRLWLP